MVTARGAGGPARGQGPDQEEKTISSVCRRLSIVSAAAALAALIGALPACSKPPVAPPPPKVSTARPLQKEIIEWDVLTGRLQATETVEVRARVSGFLESVEFRDGAIVKQGDLLFVIDPRPYQAAFDRSDAEVRRSEASLAHASSELQRGQRLSP